MIDFAIQPYATFTPDKVGAWSGIPMDIYHKLPGESNSRLSLLAESPLRYRLHADGKLAVKASHDMEIGTLIHTVVNEGGAPVYHVRPDTYGPENKKWTGNANECKEWLARHADKPVLTSDEDQMIDAVARCVRENPKAMRLLRGATPEVSAFAYNTDLDLPYLLRVRFDVLGHDDQGWYFVDTKSTRDASTDAFSREILKRDYHAQMALYRRVLKRLTGEDVRCYIMPIEKCRDVPRVNPRQLAKAAMDKGDQIIDERLKLLKRCRLSNRWPALPDDEDNDAIQFIDLPEYAYGYEDDEITISP